MRKKRFVINVFMMSASMLIIRTVGMVSNIYVTARLGAGSMGIYHMIFALFTFGITFASSGTGFAVTRIVAENPGTESSVVRKCLVISFIMSFSGALFFILGAPCLHNTFIKQPGTIKAIRILAFALPCMGASSVFRGYFIARRKASIITASSLFEEGVCLTVTILLLGKYSKSSAAYMCLVYGCALSNLAAFVFDFTAYSICIKNSISAPYKVSFKSIFSICIPIALGSYLRTGLVAAENLMIPIQFSKYGLTNAVEEYGIIKAMAMSVVTFPTVFTHAFASMLVPEMSEMNAHNRPNGIRHTSSVAISTVMMFSTFVALMLFCHHEILSRTFFKEPRVSYYLGMLSLLAIPMYLDTVADSILKGLNLQKSSLVYNITDSALRVISIFLLMPKFGPVFYIAMLYISEIFNLTLSLGKASRVTGLKPDWFGFVILPFASAVAAAQFRQPVIQWLVYIISYYVLKRVAKKHASKTDS